MNFTDSVDLLYKIIDYGWDLLKTPIDFGDRVFSFHGLFIFLFVGTLLASIVLIITNGGEKL